jgi:hypothetical protein
MTVSTYQSTTRKIEATVGGVAVKIELTAAAATAETSDTLWEYLNDGLTDGAHAAGESIDWSRVTERDVTERVSTIRTTDIIDFGDEFACRNLDSEAIA